MIVVTGAAGFIGFHVSKRLLDRGEVVVGVDNFDAYYDPSLKTARSTELERRVNFTMVRLDIGDAEALASLVKATGARRLVHLAAQAGVRYSLQNPFAYERSNVAGHLSVLEACRAQPEFEHLVYASSSSVYGDRTGTEPFREGDPVDTPISLYAATKRSAELMSIAYAHLFALPQTGLRFFTAYGPWGRPDMAYFDFTRRIFTGQPIWIFGDGLLKRDFTYIDDTIEAILGVLDNPPSPCSHRLLNIGGGLPVSVLQLVETLEVIIGRPARREFLPRQPGDVGTTYSDNSALIRLTGYQPKTILREGLERFVEWYRTYYNETPPPQALA